MVSVKGNKAPGKKIYAKSGSCFSKGFKPCFGEFLLLSMLCMLQAIHFCSVDKLTQFGLSHLRWTMKKGQNRKDQFL